MSVGALVHNLGNSLYSEKKLCLTCSTFQSACVSFLEPQPEVACRESGGTGRATSAYMRTITWKVLLTSQHLA